MPWAIDEGHVPDQLQNGVATVSGALGVVFHLRTKRLEAFRRLASGAFVKLSIGITQLDGDVSETFLVVTNGLLRVNVKKILMGRYML